MVQTALAWLDTQGAKLDAASRGRLLALLRPPGWLPGWLRGLWLNLVDRFVRLPVIILVDGDRTSICDVLIKHGSTFTADLPALGCVCSRVPVRGLPEVCCAPGVTRIWLDTPVRAVPLCGAPQVVSRYKGWGVTIAVLDTGISRQADFSGRIIAFADLLAHRGTAYDNHGRGTCVADYAARAAQGALLVGVKVLNRAGVGTASALLRGIDWVIRTHLRFRIRVMTLPIAEQSCEEGPFARAIGKACDAGITVVAGGDAGWLAGLAALLLEDRPELNPEQVKARLAELPMKEID